MKPFIIYSEVRDNKVVLTKEQFEQFISDAYNTGFSDGKNDIKPIIYPTDVIHFKDNGLKPPYEITSTCDAVTNKVVGR